MAGPIESTTRGVVATVVELRKAGRSPSGGDVANLSAGGQS